MTKGQEAHIEPSRHSTEQVDAFLEMVEDNVDAADGAAMVMVPISRSDPGPERWK